MSNAVVYARYSSHSQTEQSIEGQLAAARKYALDHNYNIIEEYCDRAKTGTNDNREEFQRMLHDCAKHQFEVIIVWKVDRFGRNREEIAFNKHHCKKHNVRVEYVAENISEGPEGVILEAVLEGMAEYYSLQLSQNIKRGKLESAKKFKPVNGSLPLGYRRNAEGLYEIDPEEAKTVLRAFQIYSEGNSLFETMRYLNDHGYRTRKGTLFTKNSLPRMFSNEAYIGTYKYKDLISAENAIPAIIDKDLFYKCRDRALEGRSKTCKDWNYADYMLSGKLVCSACGTPMVGSSGTSKTGKKYNYYKCQKCHKTIPQEMAEEKIKVAVKTAILSNGGVDKIADLVYSYYLQTDSEDQDLLQIQSELDKIESSIANLLGAVERGLDYGMIELRLEDLMNKQNVLRENLCKKKLSRPLKLTREHVVLYLDQFRNENIKDRVVEKRMLDTFLNSALIADECSLIALNISDNKDFANVYYCLEGVQPCWQEWSCANGVRTQVCMVRNTLFLKIQPC